MKESPFRTLDDVWNFALDREEAAVHLYRRLSERTRRHDLVRVFDRLAGEEEAHRRRLLAMRREMLGDTGRLFRHPEAALRSAADVLPCTEHEAGDSQAGYTAIIDRAVREEDLAARLYAALAACTADPVGRVMLLKFAEQERAHKAHLLRVRDARVRFLRDEEAPPEDEEDG